MYLTSSNSGDANKSNDAYNEVKVVRREGMRRDFHCTLLCAVLVENQGDEQADIGEVSLVKAPENNIVKSDKRS